MYFMRLDVEELATLFHRPEVLNVDQLSPKIILHFFCSHWYKPEN